MSRTPVHLVTGFLGAGKTTLLLDQLQRRKERETCAVVVNDFGEARIDAQLLGGTVQVQEIAGGCVCCTAPQDLVPALQAILDEVQPDRVFLEATGLARAADILDTLARSALKSRIELAPVVAVVDPRRLVGEAPPILLEQLDAADIVVVNWSDQAGPEALEAFEQATAKAFPPFLAVHHVTRGLVPESLFALRREGKVFRQINKPASTLGWASASRTWEPERVFDMDALKRILDEAPVERIKGLFHTDLGWYLMERAGGDLSYRPSGLRSLSAVDVIVQGSRDLAEDLLAAIDAAEHVPSEDLGQIELSDGAGWEASLNRWALAALPGQIADVSELIPGRQGQAVLLREVLALMYPPEGATFIVAASDGMVSGPTPVAEVGNAVLLHSLDGEDLPASKGGPFRVLVPKGDSACANVKKVVRIALDG